MSINKSIIPLYRCINSLSYPFIVSHYHDHNERYDPGKWSGGPAEICQNLSVPQLTGMTGLQLTQLLLQLLGEASGQLSEISTGRHVASSWWSVQTLTCHDVRDSASVGCVQWYDNSSKSPGELNNPLRGLPLLSLYPSRHVYPRSRSLDMVLWLTPKSTATSRFFNPASKWPMALARSKLDNFTIFSDQHVKVSFNP